MGNEAYLNRSGYWLGEVPEIFKERGRYQGAYHKEGDPAFLSGVTIKELKEVCGFEPQYPKADDPRIDQLKRSILIPTFEERTRAKILAILKSFDLDENGQMFVESRNTSPSTVRVWVKAACGKVYYNDDDFDIDELADLIVECKANQRRHRGIISREERGTPSANWPAY